MKAKHKSRNRDSATRVGLATQGSSSSSAYFASDSPPDDDGHDRKRQKSANDSGCRDESCTGDAEEVDSSFDATPTLSGRPDEATTATALQISRGFEANNQAIEGLQKQIEVVQEEYENTKADIKATQQEIANAATRIAEYEAEIAELGVPETLTDIRVAQYTRLEEHRKEWWEKERQLREKESKLREEKRQLREKESKLLDQQHELRAQVPAALKSSTAANHTWSQLPYMEQRPLTKLGSKVFEMPADSSLLSVDEDASFGRPQCLVVRQSGQLFADMVIGRMRNMADKSNPQRFILSGNPGTGKSVLRNYLLKLCWDNGFHVIEEVLHPASPTYILRPQQLAEKLKCTAGEALDLLVDEGVPLSQILYLCDTGGTPSEEPEPRLGCVSVLTSSPNTDHYKQFRKDGAVLFVWPTWSLEELLDAREYLFTEAMTASMLKERFEVVGGVLRCLCSDLTFTDHKRAIEAKVASLTLNDLVDFASSANAPRQIDSVTHKLFQLYPVSPFKKEHCVDGVCLLGLSAMVLPISKTVELQLLLQIPKAHLHVLWQRWHQIMTVEGLYSRSGIGTEYESVYFSLARRGRLPLMDRGPAGRGAWDTKVMWELRTPFVSSGHAAGGWQAGILYQAREFTGAIDGWLFEEKQGTTPPILWLLQMTVGAEHPIKIGPLALAVNALRQGRWAQAEVRLAFVVPHWQAKRYKTRAQHYVLPSNPSLDREQWRAAAAGSRAAPSGQWSQYYTASGRWVKRRPSADVTDKNGLTAKPFTLHDAMMIVYGSAPSVAPIVRQWVWSCYTDLAVESPPDPPQVSKAAEVEMVGHK